MFSFDKNSYFSDIRLWSVKEQTCIKALEGSDCSVLDLVWGAEGTNLISCGSDGVIRIWDCATALPLEVIEAHNERCWGINATPVSKTFLKKK